MIFAAEQLRVVRGDGKGTQCLGVLLGHLAPGDINTGSGPPSLGSLESETVKYGHESRGLGPKNDYAGEDQQQL
jgi:hypothetical protein